MTRKAKLLALIISTSLVAGCGTDAELNVRPVGAQAVLPVGDLLAEARGHFALGNVALALEQFRRAARLQPDNVSALNGMAACYDRMGRFDLSRLYYEKALALAPTDARTLHNFELSLTMQGRKDEALALARGAKPLQAPAASPAPAAAPSQDFVAATGLQGVTVPLPPVSPAPPPPAPPAPAIERAAAAAEPVERALAGPHLERLSLVEVELVTVSPAKTATAAKQRQDVRRQSAERVIQVAPGKLVSQTRTSSDWVFPEQTAKAPVSATVPAAPKPQAPAKIVSVAPESPNQPIAKPTAVVAPVRPANVRLASATVRASAQAPVAVPLPRAAPPPVRVAAKPVSAQTLPAARKPASPVAPRVQGLNAVGRRGLAGRYSLYLRARGWTAPKAADARRMRSATVIYYPVGGRAQAAALAKRLPFRATLMVSNRSGSDLLLLLGSDALAFDNRLRLRVARA
jgi:hypothetical protein